MDGVRFLYECVMGCRDDAHHGALIADQVDTGALHARVMHRQKGGQLPVARLTSRPLLIVLLWTLGSLSASSCRRWDWARPCRS